jgi:hypothetical protein
MLTRQIPLKRGVNARAARTTEDTEIQPALTALEIPFPNRAIVLVGGAGGVGFWDKFPMSKAIRIIARLAEETRSVLVDGGTQAGIMAEVGKQRKRNHFSFPLVGVVCESLLRKEESKSILDPNHTHFFLVPGEDWGDESAWISKIATAIAGHEKSITVLVNGGNIAKTDVEYSLLENRPTAIMRGTGRMADEIAAGGNMVEIDISRNTEDIFERLKAKLM